MKDCDCMELIQVLDKVKPYVVAQAIRYDGKYGSGEAIKELDRVIAKYRKVENGDKE